MSDLTAAAAHPKFPTMDPELAAQLDQLPPVAFADLERSRSVLASAGTVDVTQSWPVVVELVVAPSLDEGRDVEIHLVRPRVGDRAIPVLVWMHSGGFAMGSARFDLPWCAEVAAALGIAVAAVEYRLAPETPFPGALHDCYGSLLYLHRHATLHGLDAGTVGVGGQSAGGGLAAALALMARDQGEVSLVFQCLDVPVLDDRLLTASMHQHLDTPVWTRADAARCWEWYLGPTGPARGSADVPAYAAPARADDLTGLPPAYVTAMELDPLRDESIEYALRLLAAGVSVELHTFPGTFHRSTLLKAQSSERIKHELIGAIGRGLPANRPRTESSDG